MTNLTGTLSTHSQAKHILSRPLTGEVVSTHEGYDQALEAFALRFRNGEILDWITPDRTAH